MLGRRIRRTAVLPAPDGQALLLRRAARLGDWPGRARQLLVGEAGDDLAHGAHAVFAQGEHLFRRRPGEATMVLAHSERKSTSPTREARLRRHPLPHERPQLRTIAERSRLVGPCEEVGHQYHGGDGSHRPQSVLRASRFLT